MNMEPTSQTPTPCPYCRGPLESGFLGVAHYQLFGTARWFGPDASPAAIGLPLSLGGGEEVASGAGSVSISGFRCAHCRMLLLRYGVAGKLVTGRRIRCPRRPAGRPSTPPLPPS